MKLLFIVNSIHGSGGLERVLSIRTNILIKTYNVTVGIISVEKEENDHFYNFNPSINFITRSLHPLNFFKKRKFVKNAIKEFNPDIVTVCDDGLKGLFAPLVYNFKTPSIYERHASKSIFVRGDVSSIKNRIKFKIYNHLADFGAKFYDRVVVLTNANAREWRVNNIEIIPNPLSFEPSETSLLQNKIVISVGAHSKNKGFDRLLRSWKEIIKTHKDWQLHIYGKKSSDMYIKLAHQLEISNSVCFFEPSSFIEEKYLGASIYAMPSRSEGFGMVLIEAMACGVPCVAFDCPSGPREIIQNGYNGFLVPNNEQSSFTDRLLELIKNDALKRKLGKNAVQSIIKYRPDDIMKEWNILYNKLRK